MNSTLKILVDQRCQVYCDFVLKGEASRNSLFKIELRKGTHILEFKIGDNILTKEISIETLNKEILLKISLKDIPTKDDYCIKVKGSDQYLYNTKDNEVVDLPYKEYKEIDGLEQQNSKTYATLLNNMWGAIKHNGKELIAPQFKSFCKVFFEKYLCFEKHDERYQIYSLQGELLSTISGFEDLYGHINFLVFRNYNGGSAIYDDSLRPRTEFVYQEIESFGEKGGNYFKVLKDGYWGVIQLAEKPAENLIVLPCKFQEIEHSFPGFSVEQYVKVKYNDAYCFLDKDGLLRESSKNCDETKDQFSFAIKKFYIGSFIKSKI